jgi:Protein of unknown function (DUF1638)
VLGVVACGAIASHISDIAGRNAWLVDVHPLPPLLHNHPARIAGEVETMALKLQSRYHRVAVGYADCGTYGALDEVCRRLGVPRLGGSHCYDVFAGVSELRRQFEDEPGTYVLTDFLVRSFARSVLAELGLDRFPELRDAYFGQYTRALWLAQHPTPELTRLAYDAASRLELPLVIMPVGDVGLERELARVLGQV